MDYETSWHYDAGIHHRIGKDFDIRLVGYYTDISDYIVLDRGGNAVYPNAYGYNLDSVKFYGVELEFNSTLFNKLGFFGNYTYRASEVEEPADKPLVFWLDDLPPKHKFNLGLRYKLYENTLLTWDTRYVGEKKGESGDFIDDFTTTDIGVQQTIFKKTKLLVYVNNVFGESYQEVYGYPRPKQTLGVQIKHTF